MKKINTFEDLHRLTTLLDSLTGTGDLLINKLTVDLSSIPPRCLRGLIETYGYRWELDVLQILGGVPTKDLLISCSKVIDKDNTWVLERSGDHLDITTKTILRQDGTIIDPYKKTRRKL